MGWHRGVLIAGEDRPADAGRQMKDGYDRFNSLYAFAFMISVKEGWGPT
jgi:hypothetical protein